MAEQSLHTVTDDYFSITKQPWPNHMRPVESFLWLTAQEEVREIQCTRMIQQHRHLHCFENGGDHMARNTGCPSELRADSQQEIVGLCPRDTRNWIQEFIFFENKLGNRYLPRAPRWRLSPANILISAFWYAEQRTQVSPLGLYTYNPMNEYGYCFMPLNLW